MRLLRRTDPHRGWTGADYESLENLQRTGRRDAARLVTRARRAHPVRRAVHSLRSRLRPGARQPVLDWDVARAAAAAVNAGDPATANRIVAATADPRGHALAAFRFID